VVLAAVLLAAPAVAAAAQPDAASSAARRPAVVVRRLVLLPRMEDVKVAGAPAAGPDIDAARVPDLAGAQSQAALRTLQGKTIDEPYLAQVKAVVGAEYKRLRRPFVGIIIPRQDVTSGALQVVVVEARVGKVTVKGARWFDERQYLDAVHLTPGGPIDQPRLDADLARLNRNAYRRVTAVAQPGARTGETDIVINTEERRPFAVTAGYDNAGTDATGLDQVTAGLDWGNAFGRGDGLNYQFTGSAQSSNLREHSLGYVTDLPWGHTLNLNASYTKSRAPSGADFSSTGITKQASLRYAVPFARWRGWSQNLSLGFDFKRSNNDILFGGTSVFPTVSDVDQFVADVRGYGPDPWGSGSASLTLFASPGGLTAHNNDAAFTAQQAGAKARYAYVRLDLTQITRLPYGLAWDTQLTGQLSDGRLLSSEQLPLAGYMAVRGFVEQGAVRDEGLVWRNELRLPVVGAGGTGMPLSLAPFLFVDAGWGRQHGVSGTWVSLADTGLGADLQLAGHASVRASLGAPIATNGAQVSRLNFQFGLRASF
jgi:hemolysin activation/secretion protein